MHIRDLIINPLREAARGDGKLASLQAGRACAALLVLLLHNSVYIFILDKYWGYDPAHKFFDFGQSGVMFFFVLSGFIISLIHRGDLGMPSRFASYAKKRFLRIYPFYWLVLAAIIPIYFIVPSFGLDYHRKASTILSSILLVYFDKELLSALAVAWTLYHEVLFYCLFSLAILHKRLGFLILGAWFLLSAASLAAGPMPFPLLFLASPVHLLFGMGMAACWAVSRGRVPVPGTLALLGVALFIGTGMEENYLDLLSYDGRNLLYGAASAIILAGLVTLERQGRLHVPALLQLMGNASYSIYLTHFTALSMLAKIFVAAGAREAVPVWLSYIAMAALAVAAGIAVHLLIERPLLRRLGRSLGARPAAAGAAAGGADL